MFAKVLLVDDEPLILSALRRMLVRDGFELHFASSTFDAIHVIVSEEIDIVVTDDSMPPPNGVELIELLRAHRPNIVGVLMTGELDLERVIERLVERTGCFMIHKPWEPTKFRSLLHDAAQQVAARRAAS